MLALTRQHHGLWPLTGENKRSNFLPGGPSTKARIWLASERPKTDPQPFSGGFLVTTRYHDTNGSKGRYVVRYL